MCHWQRWPHIAAALLGLVGVARNDRLATIVIALATFAGLAAVAQWDMLVGWQPKLLILVLALLVAGAMWKKDSRILAIVVTSLAAISGLIGAYQTGMQMGVLPGPSGCTVAHAYIMGSGAPPPAVNCNVVTWSLFGLSLAAFNAIFSLLIAGMGAFLLSRKHAS